MTSPINENAPHLDSCEVEELVMDIEYRLAQMESRYEQLSQFVEQLNEVVVSQDRRILFLERELSQMRDGGQGTSGLGPLSGIRSDPSKA